MIASERRATGALAGIYAARMLGLFMILPVFALYAEKLRGVTPFKVGLAIGAYGLTQALLQIPYGWLSDRLGRKRVITAGLLLFALGSALAAVSTSIDGVIAGRALQGAGAIAAALMALVADLTREEQRLKAMAAIGLSIGISFAVAMVAGPALDHWIGVPGIFWLTAALALAAIVILHTVVPTPVRTVHHADAEATPGQLGEVLRNLDLLRVDAGIFSLHLILTATFVVVPGLLRDEAGLPKEWHWALYLPVMGLAFLLMVPFIVVAEKRRLMKPILAGAVLVMAAAELGLSRWHHSSAGIAFWLLAFFTAFNFLEASLPSLVAKLSPPASKGTAMGVYSSSQFLGAFCGGAMAGAVHGKFGAGRVFVVTAAVALVWFVVAATMRRPPHLSSHLLEVGPIPPEAAAGLAARLGALPGVAEAVVVPEEGVAYMKVDRERFEERLARELVRSAGEPG
ncbi:MAG: MFS transporter [Acidobacteria bacterium]|nr:MAG: MFS transporter [Acidobacteriota bacterium]